MGTEAPLLPTLTVMLGLGLVTFAVVMSTSFIKIAVVLFIVRNAIGVQQTPPNIVLYGISLALTVFVMTPVASEMADRLAAIRLDMATVEGIRRAIEVGIEPVREFLVRLTTPEKRVFFLEASVAMWPEPPEAAPADDAVHLLIPAFLTSELQRAFEIGFLLYLPFIVIDLVVTTILMAMGMSMVTPTIIATPMKLFLFVTVDGWTRLVEGLILSYAG
ncbi:type III secretion system export apparatus subunit SctR [Jannaschia sp. LMIT008]|uniref:type III secretion system export apparatus subunit SctR n=1 Tax=Jannaschia maritima TaxID=3032585 RepID=UPI0028110F2D|nr:type III secretion system export apparatus subunit SctR [Jannaschia sp. LMIT008]